MSALIGRRLRQIVPACRGLSLVELLVATLLGLLLSAGMVSLYLESRRQYFHDEQLARLQENGRYALNLLSRELAMAGFFGGVLNPVEIPPLAVGRDCAAAHWALDGAVDLDIVNDYAQASTASVVTTGGALLTCLDAAAIAASTDALLVKRTAAEASLRAGMASDYLTSSSTPRWYLRLQRDTRPQWRKLSPLTLLAQASEDTESSYWEAVARIFYIRNYSDPDNPADGLSTLCMESLVNDAMTTRCLVEGVENMQLELGIDTDGDGTVNRYTSAVQAAELGLAVSVRVSLLLRSIQPVAGHRDSREYRVGALVLPARHDAFMRRVFTTTVHLRNGIWPISPGDLS